jgi:hypothetical protein
LRLPALAMAARAASRAEPQLSSSGHPRWTCQAEYGSGVSGFDRHDSDNDSDVDSDTTAKSLRLRLSNGRRPVLSRLVQSRLAGVQVCPGPAGGTAAGLPDSDCNWPAGLPDYRICVSSFDYHWPLASGSRICQCTARDHHRTISVQPWHSA